MRPGLSLSVLFVTVLVLIPARTSYAACQLSQLYQDHSTHSPTVINNYAGPITGTPNTQTITLGTTYKYDCVIDEEPIHWEHSVSYSRTHSWSITGDIEAGVSTGGILAAVVGDAHVDVGGSSSISGSNSISYTDSVDGNVYDCGRVKITDLINKHTVTKTQTIWEVRWRCSAHFGGYVNECPKNLSGDGTGWTDFAQIPWGVDGDCNPGNDPCLDCYDPED